MMVVLENASIKVSSGRRSAGRGQQRLRVRTVDVGNH